LGPDPVVADVDGDGAPDLTVPQWGEIHALLHLGDGAGGLASPLKLWFPYAPSDVDAIDLGDDGLADFVLTFGADWLGVLRNRGAFQFDPLVEVPSAGGSWSIDLADVDEDGDVDVLVSGSGAAGVGLHRLDEGELLPAEIVPAQPVGAVRFAVADVVGGPGADLVILRSYGRFVQVIERNEGGGWYGQLRVEIEGAPVTSELESWTTARLDDDAVPDLFACFHGAVSAASGGGDGTFGPWSALELPLESVIGAEAGDFDGDGDDDVVVIGSFVGFVFRGHGAATPGAPLPLPPIVDARAFSVGDLDLDGDLDLALGAWTVDSASWMGDGAGGFQPSAPIANSSGTWNTAIADFDLDGAPDVVFARPYVGELRVVFAPGTTSAPSVAVTPWAESLEDVDAGDVDADGFPDLLAAQSWPSQRVLRFSGQGAAGLLAPVVVHEDGGHPRQVSVRDVDGDGHRDVVVGFGAGGVARFGGDGRGGLTAPALVWTADSSRMELADVDADGRLDVLGGGLGIVPNVTVSLARPVDWWTAVGAGCPGDGGFTPSLQIPVCHDPKQQLGVTITGAAGGAAALLLVGPTSPSTPIGSSPCALHVAPVVVVPVPLGGTGPGTGAASLLFAVPPVVSGVPFALQAAAADAHAPPGFTTTNALSFLLP
ncbi:MAG: FG-GAP repeat domain-containing protein, partial [Planctomycetota bacterium JB042]